MSSDDTLAEYVEETRRTLEDAVLEPDLTSGGCMDASGAAFAMLALGRIDEAKSWLKNTASEQADAAVTVKKGKVKHAERNDEPLTVRNLRWREFHHAAVFAGPTADEATFDLVGRTLYEHATDPSLDDLDDWERAYWPYYIAGLGALYRERAEVDDFCRKARSALEQDRNDWQKTFMRTLLDIVEAIASGQERAVEDAIEMYLHEHHEEVVVGNPEGFPLPFRRVSAEATSFLTVARTTGIDVHVDSGHIPEAVYDEDHYPLGGH